MPWYVAERTSLLYEKDNPLTNKLKESLFFKYSRGE